MKYGDYSNKKPKYAKTRVQFNCHFCNKTSWDSRSKYAKKKKHYCSTRCYAKDRKINWKPEEHNAWKGGITPYESHRKWAKNNPERMAHLKARQYARKRNAEGSHTLEEWQELCKKSGNRCVKCFRITKLTKDHIKPLSEGGSDYISNIQPLCRNCNSRKWKFYSELIT